jgi:hypothetical protein
VFPEQINIKRFRGQIISFWPLPLPVRVIQDGSPFASGEGWEVVPALLLECTVQEEKMVIKNALILFITTPKEMNWREGEPSSLGEGMEFNVIDVACGNLPDLMYFQKPSRCSSNISDASEF